MLHERTIGFGKMIHEVVPFFPLEQTHLQTILTKKFQILSKENQFLYWSQLIVDNDVVEYLVGQLFMIIYTHLLRN